ncbi:PAS domain-containing sensor histidine kinase [Methanobacterium sp.]|uniref:PAS domain-containing sensor histidine kinase n=1 Tax=Methanobacterium sp. TaxID=2164 RepID=UPI003C781192
MGYTNEEFQNMAPVDIVVPEKRVEMASHAIEIWTNGYARFEIIHKTKDGKKIPVEVNTHIFKFNGETVALGVSRDIRDRKDTEEKLDKLLNKLSHLNEEFEQCTHITANYLQEHLGIITDTTKQLKYNYKGKLDINALNFMDSIVYESEHLKQMLLNLLEYENISRTKINFEHINAEKSLDNTLSGLKIDENNVIINYDPLPKVIADKEQITKVFHDLITNAIDFKREDKTLKIHISAFKDNEQNEHVFSVQDNGIGMNSWCMERIFTIYYHFYLWEQYGIKGTCLSSAKKIVEKHGGKVWVESEEGIGSTFYFTLPIIPSDALKASTPKI